MLEIGPEKCAADSKSSFKDDEMLLQMHVSKRLKLKTEFIFMHEGSEIIVSLSQIV